MCERQYQLSTVKYVAPIYIITYILANMLMIFWQIDHFINSENPSNMISYTP